MVMVITIRVMEDSILFSERAEKMEVIVTFMALLEMIAHGEIRLRQSAPFAPITVSPLSLLAEDGAYSYMDEVDGQPEEGA